MMALLGGALLTVVILLGGARFVIDQTRDSSGSGATPGSAAPVDSSPSAVPAVAPPSTSAPPPPRVRPREERLQDAIGRTEVKLYATNWCPQCRRAEAFMDQRGIRYVRYDIDADPAANAVMRRLNPRRSIPTMDIDGIVVVGYSPRSIEDALLRSIGQL